MDNKIILRMEDITKSFPGVKALKGVNFNLKKGEVHALVGENGAGKSTLMKCLIGIYKPTEGRIWYDGEYVAELDTRKALHMGISMIHQELSPIEHRTISENIWLGREPKTALGLIDYRKMHTMTQEALKLVNLNENPKQIMKNLTVAKVQMIEIAKAVTYDAKIIIMDEPTSALTEKEVLQLFSIIKRLKQEGRSIIYISHKLDEIYAVCDYVTIFRDGEMVGNSAVGDIAVEDMIRMMVGREVKNLFPKQVCNIGETVLEVRNLSSGKEVQNVSFVAKKGEILGFAGLVGSGRSQIMEAIFGVRKIDSGEIFISGKKTEIKSPVEAIRNKVAFLTEDRRSTGIFPMLSVRYNTICSNITGYRRKNGFLNYRKMNQDVNRYIQSIRIKTPSSGAAIQNLSGGNQQKVLIARWLLTNPEILILDEPTRGIDVGAKAEIYSLISELAVQGKCIIMISSELPEIIGMSDRVVVMHEGKKSGELCAGELDQEILMRYATGKTND